MKRSSEEPVDDADELRELLLPGLSVLLIGVCVSTFEDRQLEALLKLLGCP